jgi:hypothetical protein
MRNPPLPKAFCPRGGDQDERVWKERCIPCRRCVALQPGHRCSGRAKQWLRRRALLFGSNSVVGPIRLPAPVNNPTANEQGPALSADGLALYLCSNRPPSAGNDLGVARRASKDDPWGERVNLGPAVNSFGGDCGPSLSLDGRLLFFTSNRTGGAGGNDIYMSSRTDTTDDLSWGPMHPAPCEFVSLPGRIPLR